MRHEKFAVLILTHGRPDNVKTVKTLHDYGYTGDFYIVIDNEDDTAGGYYQRYKEKVIMFDKADIANRYDQGDNRSEHRTVFYARNASFEIAKKLGLTYFLELDDDYIEFDYRTIRDNKFIGIKMLKLDALFDSMLDFLDVSKAITITFAQGGDFIGGKDNDNFHKGILRKAMNTFFCRVDRPFQFYGKINEDVSMYTLLGSRGNLMFTVTAVSITQTPTQKNSGGMTDIYMDTGTYVKSFYSVMYMPSAVKVAPMGDAHIRLHHRVAWNNCVPKILHERFKKQ